MMSGQFGLAMQVVPRIVDSPKHVFQCARCVEHGHQRVEWCVSAGPPEVLGHLAGGGEIQPQFVLITSVRMWVNVGELHSPVVIGHLQYSSHMLDVYWWHKLDRVAQLRVVCDSVLGINGEQELDAVDVAKRPQEPLKVTRVELLTGPLQILHDQQDASADGCHDLGQLLEQLERVGCALMTKDR